MKLCSLNHHLPISHSPNSGNHHSNSDSMSFIRILHISEFMQYFIFCVWFISLGIMSFIQVLSYCHKWQDFLLFLKAKHSIVLCWRRLLRVHWTSRRSNQSILKEISPGCLLEGLILKLKLQYFGHLCKELTHWKRPWCWERWGHRCLPPPWPDKMSLHKNPCVCYLKASAFIRLVSQFCLTSWLKDSGLRSKNLVTIKFY